MKPPTLTLGDFEASAHPVLASDAPPLHPDLGDDLRARDRALDEDAAGEVREPPAPGPTEGENLAAADIDAAIAEARARGATVTAWIRIDSAALVHDPLEDLP
jgi:hypothetical protein